MNKIKPYAIYVHWPFCLSKCPYCDFNSHVRDNIDEDAFLRGYIQEIDNYAENYSDITISSIFFGGGTPSLMSPKTVAAIIERIAHHWPSTKDIEITLEANPTSVEAGRFKGFRAAGVNRLSLGVQSLVDSDLKALGRHHSVDEALAALTLAKENFPRFSFDLIYARENQTLEQWRVELDRALQLAGDHLALYQLTIEPGTKFQGLYNKGKLILPEESLAEDMFFLTREMTKAAGLPAYEVSNHAMSENRSRHNMAYWAGQSYMGIGPGAHGRLRDYSGKTTATNNWKKPEAWLRAVTANNNGQEQHTLLSKEENGIERLMMGLRINEGVAMSELQGVLNKDAMQALCDEGFLKVANGRLRLMQKGQCLLDHILVSLLA